MFVVNMCLIECLFFLRGGAHSHGAYSVVTARTSLWTRWCWWALKVVLSLNWNNVHVKQSSQKRNRITQSLVSTRPWSFILQPPGKQLWIFKNTTIEISIYIQYPYIHKCPKSKKSVFDRIIWCGTPTQGWQQSKHARAKPSHILGLDSTPHL